MALNKKGMFFTAAAIGITLVVIFALNQPNTASDKADIVISRVETMNFFLKNIEKEMQNGAKISAIRTFMSFNDYIEKNNAYVDNVYLRFNESFLFGTIGGQLQHPMSNYTFSDWNSKISNEAAKTGIIVNASVKKLSINQSDPWTVDLNLTVGLNLTDIKGTGFWFVTKDLLVKIDIQGIKDPLYTNENNGDLNNSIKISNISNFVASTSPSGLLNHTNGSFYTNRSTAPSFLMRFEGNLGASRHGIESLVDLQELSDRGIGILDRSIVDYIYFGSQSTTNHRINNTPSWLKIDSGNLDFYDVENITCVPAQCQVP